MMHPLQHPAEPADAHRMQRWEAGEAVLGAVAFATERFLRDDLWSDRIGEVLERLGSAAQADRAYLFQNVRDDAGRLTMDLRFEWCTVTAPTLFEDPENHLFPYAPTFARWIEVLGRGDVIVGAVSDSPRIEREMLESEAVVTQCIVPVFVGPAWWGFLGFDDCRAGRAWSAVETDALRAAAGALGAAIEREVAEREGRAAERRFRTMIEQLPAITYVDVLREDAPTLYISPQVEAILGYTPQEWIGDAEMWPRVLHPDDRARALAENARHNETGEPFALEYRVRAKDGRVVWLRDEAVLVRDERGQPLHSQGVMMDISERRRAEERVAFLAYHDDLTGLPNRAMFEELLELSIARARRHDGSVAVVNVDVDDFSLVNDSLGHANGDALLTELAHRLRVATRETDLVARKGSDQFLLLLADLERDGTGELDAALIRAESVAQRVHEVLRDPFVVDGTELYVSVSVGISLFPQDAPDAPDLLHNAEAAMRESKKAGPAGYVVSSRGAADPKSKLSYVTKLRKAVERSQWVLHYQPVVELATGETVGVEALIRWVDPEGGMIPPTEFIPLAEELGLIESIGDWVLEEIGRQDLIWRANGLDLEIGFNLSPRQFWQPDLSERILSRIEAGALDPRRIMVEITESSAMMDPDRAQQVLWDLHARGLRVAIDDFGTGYSNLSRLREVPVEILKIDRTFVMNVDTDPQAASIVTAFIELGRGLGMTTLAEGIESEGEWRFLADRGCTLGQGFYFSRPVPGDEIVERHRSGRIVAVDTA
jgi:diguanylate cyclase (GGDEF)-like protein/PAS domain S-box-containing protein